jgi:23S rRNA-/tRNA-specific pseudouridylate synthase
MLHAWRLRFNDMHTGKPVRLEADPPRDFMGVLKVI